jgi:hypothetical protein
MDLSGRDHIQLASLDRSPHGIEKLQFTAAEIQGLPSSGGQRSPYDRRDMIADLLSGPSSFDDAGVTQNGQMMGHVGLRAA